MAIETFIRGFEADNDLRAGFATRIDRSMWNSLAHNIAEYINLINDQKTTGETVLTEMNAIYA